MRYGVVCVLSLVLCFSGLILGYANAQQEEDKLASGALRLYVMQAAGMSNVQEELKLSDDQLAKMAEIRRSLTAAKDAAEHERAVSKAAKTIQGVLSPAQAERLMQIHLQSLMVKALLLPDVLSALKIDDEQRKKLQLIDSSHSEKRRALAENASLSPQERRAKTGQLWKDVMAEALAVLAPSQREKFEKMLGPEFDFSRRVFPPPGYPNRKRGTSGEKDKEPTR